MVILAFNYVFSRHLRGSAENWVIELDGSSVHYWGDM